MWRRRFVAGALAGARLAGAGFAGGNRWPQTVLSWEIEGAED